MFTILELNMNYILLHVFPVPLGAVCTTRLFFLIYRHFRQYPDDSCDSKDAIPSHQMLVIC